MPRTGQTLPPAAPPWWRRQAVALPWGASLLLHATVLLLGFLTYRAVVQVRSLQVPQTIVPVAAIVEHAPLKAIELPGQASQLPKPSDPALPTPPLDALAHPPGRLNHPSADISWQIGIGPGAARAFGASNLRSDATNDSAPFGVPGGTAGLTSRAPFMGVSGNAMRIAYICDGSGSMTSVQALVRKELVESINQLKPIQFFNVFFYQNAATSSFDPARLLPATPATKRAVASWIQRDYLPSGSANPLPAIQIAFAQKVELIYLLTDGLEDASADHSTANAVRQELRKLNHAQNVKVNTIFLRRGDRPGTSDGLSYSTEAEELAKILRLIATENGGQYKLVDQ